MTTAVDRRHGLLQALVNYYARMDDVEAPGWSREKFGWCVIIAPSGKPVHIDDLHELSLKKPRVKPYRVPASYSRTGTKPQAFLLWDKTPYALGVTKAKSDRGWEITPRQHEAFRTLHLDRLAHADDQGLVALRHFLERWTPERFGVPPFTPEMLDANIMFRLDGDSAYLHERPAARLLVETGRVAGGGPPVLCLATGERAPAARLHPAIKGVEGAQSTGAPLVSFNLNAFESYGKEQGDNAPTSEMAAFQYGTALNRLLTRDGPNRVKRRIGDATTVFWADASNATAAKAADDWFGAAFGMEIRDADEARKIGEDLDAIAQGRRLSALRPAIEPGTRFHVLGLSPNAARLSVRFWLSDTLDLFASRLAAHHADLHIEPSPWTKPPSINHLLARTTALQGKFENIPPLLAGEIVRAMLTGGPYPRSWLAAILIRLRAGDDPSHGWHAAAIRAVLVRGLRQRRTTSDVSKQRETPMSLDRGHGNIAYQLGRLFAVYELAQRAALGRGVKATIRDKYYGTAAATPARIFPLVIAGGQKHLSKVRKEKPGWAHMIEKELEEVMGRIETSLPFSLPRSLRLEHQGEFAIGYYHQRRAKLGDGTVQPPTFDENTEQGSDNDD
jgi:CRISPR-associated protein Csd1